MMEQRARALVAGLAACAALTPAAAQTADPAVGAASAVARDQARRAAETQAAERQARQVAPRADLQGQVSPPSGAFPVETPCFVLRDIVVDTKLPRALRWVPGELARFKGRCAGHQGLDHILKALQAAFLDRGFVTTRAGLPEQDMATGTLHVIVVPGVETAVRGGSARSRHAWAVASPMHPGDLVNIRAIEQGLEQMRRVPGREASVDLAPGAEPGDTILDLHAKPVRPISASVSVNNLAGETVGRWQASAQVSALDLLGLNEIVTGYYNSRIGNPALPADSKGSGGSFSIPWGWWTFGVAGSANRYGQHIIGQVQDFVTRGTLAAISATAEHVLHRDRISKTGVQFQLQRRWGRSYIDDIEIGLQHQDLTDLQFALIERRRFARVQLDGELAYRIGVGILGAQKDEPGQPAALPSARYRIGTLDLALTAPLGDRIGYRAAFRGQLSDRQLFGPDLLSVGGPYTVRGYDGDHALLGRSGWYLRQELSVRVDDRLQPYGLIDMGGVRGTEETPLGVGAGIRIAWKGFTLDSFVAIPLTASHRSIAAGRSAQVGVSAGWGL